MKVLRLRPGSPIRISIKGDRYQATLMLAEQPGLVCAKIDQSLPSTEARVRITLYQGVPKGDKLEQIVRQCTELGVHAIVPVLFKRCVAQLENPEKRLIRLNKIAREAAMQSGRSLIPQVSAPLSFPLFLQQLALHQQTLVAYEQAGDKQLVSLYRGGDDIALVIGPEGGLTSEELTAMHADVITLGPRILRTETAGVAAIAMIRALAKDVY